jgi:hypothetical protein
LGRAVDGLVGTAGGHRTLTAKLNKLTIKVDRPQLSPADIKKLQDAMLEKAKAD